LNDSAPQAKRFAVKNHEWTRIDLCASAERGPESAGRLVGEEALIERKQAGFDVHTFLLTPKHAILSLEKDKCLEHVHCQVFRVTGTPVSVPLLG